MKKNDFFLLKQLIFRSKIKILSRVALHKIEFQYHWHSKIMNCFFVILSLWRSPNDMFQEQHFGVKFLIFDQRETGRVKKLLRKAENYILSAFAVYISKKVIFFQLFLEFFSFFMKIIEKNHLFQLIRKLMKWKRSPSIWKLWTSSEKIDFSQLKNKKMLMSISICVKNFLPTAGFEPASCKLPDCGATPTYVMYQTRTILQTRTLRVKGRIRKRKKTPTTELNIFLSETFSTENKKQKVDIRAFSFNCQT